MKRFSDRNKVRPARGRRQDGSILLLVFGTVGIMVVVSMAYLAMCGIFENRGVVQNKTESFALASALRLNEQNYAGRVNELTAHSRELVFDSRQLRNKVSAEMPDLAPLAQQLVEESRDGSRLVEEERQLLGEHIIGRLTETTDKLNKVESKNNPVAFIGGVIGNSRVINLEIGDIEGMPSNVEVPSGNPSLLQYDGEMGYTQPKKELYPANVNLKLPNEDSDLNFELSALPSRPSDAQRNSAPPAALYSVAKFHSSAYLVKNGKQSVVKGVRVPSAVRCALAAQVHVDAGPGSGTKGNMVVNTVAGTNGANQEI